MTADIERTILLDEVDHLKRAVGRYLPHAVDNPFGGAKIRDNVARYLSNYFSALETAVLPEALFQCQIISRARWPIEGMRVESLKQEMVYKISPVVDALDGNLLSCIFGPSMCAYYLARLVMRVRSLEAAADAPKLGPSPQVLDWLGRQNASPHAVANWALSNSARKVRNMSVESKDRIARVVSRGIFEGKTVNEIGHDIQGEFADMRLKRAMLIANTETNEALSVGAEMKALDEQATRKTWETMDSAACSHICQLNEAAGEVEIGVPFPSGHMRTPGHPDCRCGNGYVGGRVPSLLPEQPSIVEQITPDMIDAALAMIVGKLPGIVYRSGFVYNVGEVEMLP